jgi:hypothetical protein
MRKAMKLVSMTKMFAGAMLAMLLVSAPAFAQRHRGDDSSQKGEQKKETLYPNATREEPKLDLKDQKDADTLNKGLDAVNNGDTAQAQQILQPLADGSGTKSKYAQALALQGLANLKYNQQDVKGAITLLKQAIDIGVMPNDTYYQLMYMLAQFYVADEQYDQALATLQKWRTEGKRETADSYALEGNIDYRLQKYPEAIAAIQKAKSMTDQPKESWDQILAASYAESGQSDQALELAKAQLAKNPNDSTTLHNTVALLIQAEKYPDAVKLMEQARSSGALTQEKDYINMAKLYLLIGQNGSDPEGNAGKAVQVLDEGMAKGVIKPGYDVYKLQGDAAYIGGDHAKAMAAYAKASPLGKDGEADLRRGQLLIEDHKYTEGKKVVKSAISKGVKHTGTAWMLVAEAERATKNKTAAVAAMKKAAQDPETRSRAQAWLKSAGH